MSGKLTFEDIAAAAASLGLEPCAVKAVVAVESGGSGFLPEPDGRVKILFEGHIFFRELSKRNINPKPYCIQSPNIVYPAWDRSKYKGGAAEWERLNAAALIHREAALCSASWGLFQIMGFNHAACGYDTVEAYVDAQSEGEAKQLEAFCAYMRSRGLVKYLAAKDWAGFARRYNGPGYAENRYDEKLGKAYERCKATS